MSITYYFGQIKQEYRGDKILMLDWMEEKRDISFASFPMSNIEEIVSVTEGKNLPMRVYAGINEQAEMKISEMWKEKAVNLWLLDFQIVKDEIVRAHQGITKR